MAMVISIELDDGKILTGKPNQFDGKNPWVSGVDFPNKTNPMIFQQDAPSCVVWSIFLRKKRAVAGGCWLFTGEWQRATSRELAR